MAMRVFVFILSLIFGATLIPADVLCLDYPTREIEFICAFGAGSNNDNSSRMAAKYGEKYVGRPIVVVNRPGGSGVRGYASIAAAKPDGYTIGLTASSIVSLPYLVKGANWHYKKNYRVICQIDINSQGLFVKKGSPYDIALSDLIRKAKQNPDTIKLGLGNHWGTQDFVRAVFQEEAGVKFIKVPFTPTADAIPALLGGHVDLEIGPASEWSPLYKAGKVNVIAATTEQRDPRFPDIPTFRELGYDIVFGVYHWISAPAGTPDAIIHFLAEGFKKGFAEETFKQTVYNLGATPAWEGPEGALKNMEKVYQIYQKVIKKYDLKPE